MKADKTPTDRRWPAWIAGAVLGALQAASFSPPIGAWWLQLLTLSGLLTLTLRSTHPPRHRWPVVAAFGIGWFTVGLSWLHTSMHVYGGMPWSLAAVAVLLFAAYLALFPLGALGLATVWTRGRAERPDGRFDVRIVLTVAACWGLSEWLRGGLFTGFPWLSIGYAHVDGPLAGFAPWIGVYGVGMAAAAVAVALAQVAQTLMRRDTLGPGATTRSALKGLALVTLVLAVGSGLGRIETTRPLGAPVTVRLVQGNVPQQLKFDRQQALRAMDAYAAMIEDSRAQLTVLPETAWTVPWWATPAAIATRIERHARENASAVAIGMPLAEADERGGRATRLTNSVALIGSAGPEDRPVAPISARYDKRHLVPFGEFVPPGFRWFVDLMHIPLGDFGRGAATQAPFSVAGQRFAFNICYEDLFGEELLGAIRAPGNASVLVNVSNIAWFGNSHALPQHLAIARMRTLETGRPMLRATNTGVTASIDHRGRVVAALPPYRHDVLDVSVQGTEGLTPYVRWGNAAPVALALSLLALMRLSGRSRRPRKR